MSFSVEQVGMNCFNKVEGEFIKVHDGMYMSRKDILFPVEGLELTNHTNISVFPNIIRL